MTKILILRYPALRPPALSSAIPTLDLTMASVQAIAARPVLCRPAVHRPALRAHVSARRSVLVRASPEQLAKENSLSALEQAIADAKKQCDEASANECASAWDTVEELSAAIAHKKAQASDPLDKYCDDNPEADECRVYED
ncbi:g7004 [Coccomyxa viridis]|uniref:G7004 protein n=1 Tax=Coccomyxa viridis TaxID=1274662 RepID=A0ABP1FWS1_9CHLO